MSSGIGLYELLVEGKVSLEDARELQAQVQKCLDLLIEVQKRLASKSA